ncbi:MAG: hypothetical protein L0H96_24110, partial [Humibacillus sp.]|nr:hypothetical protein [Humibacillus sp.]MDN5779969.1 hypothetical protein [Humibacillus sp.]
MTDHPEIVCICGSARFMAEMRKANRELTFTGVIVVAPSEADEAPTPEQKAVLDALHLSKIDLEIARIGHGRRLGLVSQR